MSQEVGCVRFFFALKKPKENFFFQIFFTRPSTPDLCCSSLSTFFFSSSFDPSLSLNSTSLSFSSISSFAHLSLSIKERRAHCAKEKESKPIGMIAERKKERERKKSRKRKTGREERAGKKNSSDLFFRFFLLERERASQEEEERIKNWRKTKWYQILYS